MLPLLLYTTFRRYLQAIGLVTPVMTALVTANLVNAGVNWLLIFGNLGAPQLGVDGAAWATCISRIYLALFLFVMILRHHRRFGGGLRKIPVRLERRRLASLVMLGLPAAVQVTLEVGAFAVVTLLAGQLESVDLAAHQVVLNIVSVTFMVPLGIGSAGAVRVGHAIGRCDFVGARRAGWSALTLGGGFMIVAAIVFVLEPRALLSLFTVDVAVVQSGVALLLVAALFQLFDGLQGVATGALRGLGDTRTPMLWNLGGHWIVGLPVGYLLAFVLGWGVVGLWIGLSVGLTVVGVVLAATWWNRTRAWQAGRPEVSENCLA
jgi:MATE family multidrug resistance protein